MSPLLESKTETQQPSKFSVLIKKKWASTVISLLMILFTSVILGYLLYNQREILLTYHWRLRWGFLVVAFVLHGLTLVVGALVWSSIISVIGPRLAFKHHFRFFCLNMLARRLPGTVWYVVYRAQAYNRYGINASTTTLGSGIEVAIAIVSGIISTFIFSVPILIQWGVSFWVLAVVFAICMLLLNPRLLRWVVRKSSKESVRLNYSHLVKWIGLYILLWVLGGIILFLIINMFTYVPAGQISYVIGSWTLVGTSSYMLLLLPSNFGFSEASISLLLAQIIPSSLAVLAAIATRVIFIVFEIVWSGSLLLLKLRE